MLQHVRIGLFATHYTGHVSMVYNVPNNEGGQTIMMGKIKDSHLAMTCRNEAQAIETIDDLTNMYGEMFSFDWTDLNQL